MQLKKGTALKVFMEMIGSHNSDECLMWPYANTYGYGVIQNRPYRYRVHVLSWEVTHAMQVPADRWVLHRCDNPKCFNPRHLFLGTAQDNTRDMWAKGRGWVHAPMRGSDNPCSKLTEEQVLTMRRLRAQGMKLKEIASIVGAKIAVTSHITNRRIWRHLP